MIKFTKLETILSALGGVIYLFSPNPEVLGAIAPAVLASIITAGGGLLGGLLGGGGSAPKSVKRAAGAEAELREGQLSTAEQILALILGRGPQEGIQIPGKAGAGLSPEELGRLASSIPLSTLLALPGMFQTGGAGLAGATSAGNLDTTLGAQTSGAFGSSLAQIIALLLQGGGGEEAPNENILTLPPTPPLADPSVGFAPPGTSGTT
jgi:hypothetical protein